MSKYVTADYVKLIGSMPPSDIDDLESVFPGSFDAVSEAVSRMFDARLAKRYATPFDPVPEAVKWYVAQVVVAQLWLKRGYNPGSAQDEAIQNAKTEALDWLKEAANSKDGLVELPIREPTTPDASAVKKGGPLSYTEVSPYTWTDLVRDRLRSGKK